MDTIHSIHIFTPISAATYPYVPSQSTQQHAAAPPPQSSSTHTHTHIHTHINTHTRTHQTHTYKHTHTRVCTYIYIHLFKKRQVHTRQRRVLHSTLLHLYHNGRRVLCNRCLQCALRLRERGNERERKRTRENEREREKQSEQERNRERQRVKNSHAHHNRRGAFCHRCLRREREGECAREWLKTHKHTLLKVMLVAIAACNAPCD